MVSKSWLLRLLFLSVFCKVLYGCSDGSDSIDTMLVSERVTTTSGVIEGFRSVEGNVWVYRGIPYAAPPVGDRRWREPEPAAAWDGVRSAQSYGAACNQVDSESVVPPWTDEFLVRNDDSEDCLFLNVWSPAVTKSDSLPVLVYIHGGAFMHGSSDVSVYNGAALAEFCALRGSERRTRSRMAKPFGGVS